MEFGCDVIDIEAGAIDPGKRRTDMPALIALLPFLTQFAPVFIAAIQHIKSQTGKTTDEIFSEAQIVLDSNSAKLLEDLKRLGVV